MSFLLCHECFNWVEPDGDRCPDCWQVLDAGIPDPSLEDLSEMLGEVVSCLGEVAIRRSTLPGCGLLYATTHGLFFLPHKTETVTELIEIKKAGHSLLWSVASIIWSPLIFVLPFLKTKEMVWQQVQVSRPQFLSAIDSSRMPELLMENPGVFFVPRRAVLQIGRSRNRWIIERRHGTRLIFKPQSDRKRFHEKMSELVASENWNHFTAVF